MSDGFAGFPATGMAFLADLAEHNDRDWFKANRAGYDDGLLAPGKAFVVAIGERLEAIAPGVHAEPRVNGSIFRINRDTRFSKDKTPYKTYFDMMFWQGQGRGRENAAYFFRLTATGVHLGCGIHGFDKTLLAAWREAMDDDARGVAAAAAIAAVRDAGPYEVGGAHYKRVPRGYAPDHPRAELLKNNALWVGHELPMGEFVHSAELLDVCMTHYAAMEPVQRWVVEFIAAARA